MSRKPQKAINCPTGGRNGILLILKNMMKAIIQASGVEDISLLRGMNTPLKGVLEKMTMLDKACYKLIFALLDLLNKKSIYIYQYHTVCVNALMEKS